MSARPPAVACLLVGRTPAPGLLGLPHDTPSVPLPRGLLRSDGRVLAEDLVELVNHVSNEGPLVAITSSPLATREHPSLLGFTHRRRALALVSLAGLGEEGLLPSAEEVAPAPLKTPPEACAGEPGAAVGPYPPPNRPTDVLLRSRLHNLMAHEMGHLQGLAHCATPGCLMNPVRRVQDLDRRGSRPCGRCPPLRWWTPWLGLLRCAPVRGRAWSQGSTP